MARLGPLGIRLREIRSVKSKILPRLYTRATPALRNKASYTASSTDSYADLDLPY